MSQTDFIFSAQSFEKFNLSNIRLTLSGQFPIFGIYWQNIIPNKKETVDREVCGLSRMNRTYFLEEDRFVDFFVALHTPRNQQFKKKKKKIKYVTGKNKCFPKPKQMLSVSLNDMKSVWQHLSKSGETMG